MARARSFPAGPKRQRRDEPTEVRRLVVGIPLRPASTLRRVLRRPLPAPPPRPPSSSSSPNEDHAWSPHSASTSANTPSAAARASPRPPPSSPRPHPARARARTPAPRSPPPRAARRIPATPRRPRAQPDGHANLQAVHPADLLVILVAREARPERPEEVRVRSALAIDARALDRVDEARRRAPHVPPSRLEPGMSHSSSSAHPGRGTVSSGESRGAEPEAEQQLAVRVFAVGDAHALRRRRRGGRPSEARRDPRRARRRRTRRGAEWGSRRDRRNVAPLAEERNGASSRASRPTRG